jgi:hypothetical protein
MDQTACFNGGYIGLQEGTDSSDGVQRKAFHYGAQRKAFHGIR